ncbi:MAG: transposase [Planctomycetales bacterium]|nr:transposase [Planctomycetales bacterium]
MFDRFHIVKLMNEKLTQLRRDLQREAEMMSRNVLKGMRWLLVKYPDHLDESKNERIRLQEAGEHGRSSACALSRQKPRFMATGNASNSPKIPSKAPH